MQEKRVERVELATCTGLPLGRVPVLARHLPHSCVQGTRAMRPLLLVELYAGVYVVYRILLIVVGSLYLFCAEYFDLPPLVPAVVVCARE